jgi:hypothetical protein
LDRPRKHPATILPARSGSQALFFNGFPATAGNPHTLGGLAVKTLHFCTSAPDRYATDPRDLVQELDAATSPLESQQSNKTPPMFFIQPCY